MRSQSGLLLREGLRIEVRMLPTAAEVGSPFSLGQVLSLQIPENGIANCEQLRPLMVSRETSSTSAARW